MQLSRENKLVFYQMSNDFLIAINLPGTSKHQSFSIYDHSADTKIHTHYWETINSLMEDL